MLLVAVEFRVAPGDRIAFAAAAAALAAATRLEEGCRFFEIWSDLGSEGRFLAFEGWEDRDALVAHRGTQHIAAFREALQGIEVLGTDASYWHATETSA
jgi:quinol monooxygenase YgiN